MIDDNSVLGFLLLVCVVVIFCLVVLIHEREIAWQNECVEFRGVNESICDGEALKLSKHYPISCENYVAFKCVKLQGGVLE